MEAEPMKKVGLISLLLALCSTLAMAQTSEKRVDFSGSWVLDRSQTKNLPDGLENYTMTVAQGAQQLKVETTLEGDLRPTSGSSRNGTQGAGDPGGYPGGRRGGGLGLPGRIGLGLPIPGMPGGGGGWPGGGGTRGGGGGSGRTRGEGRVQAGVVAFTSYPATAVYNLDGTETTAQLGGPTHNDATIRADVEKGGKELKLFLLEHTDSDQSGSEMQIKDQWKLADDGQSLLVDRTVRTSRGSGTVHLVFLKRQADSNNKTAQSQFN